MGTEISIEERLEERVKELSCLYEVSSAIREHNEDPGQTLLHIITILKQAWRFPEYAVVEIEIEEYHLKTSEIPENSHFQESKINLFEQPGGFLKVHYPARDLEMSHFLIEEQKLLDKVAYEISLFFERLQTRKKQEILQQTAERNDRLAILGEITAGIAHELNTPLGNILGFAEFIKEKAADPQIHKDTEKIIKAAIYSREVVKKLMFFACEMPQNIQAIKIKPVVTQALALLKPNFRKAGLSYEFHIQDSSLEAQVDPIQLTQVLFNLIINAIYHSPKNSVIKIEISNSESRYFIEVSDQGVGIPDEQKEKVFQPFFTTKPAGDGSGLGLSVVHGIIKGHKGEIAIFDNSPRGSRFKISLPIRF